MRFAFAHCASLSAEHFVAWIVSSTPSLLNLAIANGEGERVAISKLV